jgi:plasmid stabilization system protein ParE
LRVQVSNQANQQISEADFWWRENRLKAPNAIRDEVVRIGALIATHPHLGARATNVKLRGVRRIHIERVHYDVYYRTVGSPPEYVEVLAFWSSRRGSGPPI